MTAAVLVLSLFVSVGLADSSAHAGPIWDIQDTIDAFERNLRKSVDVRGTSWSTSGRLKLKRKRLGSTHRFAPADLFFGPQEVVFDSDHILLADGEFLLVLDDGETSLPAFGRYKQKFVNRPPKLFLKTGLSVEALLLFLGEPETAEELHLKRVKIRVRKRLRQKQVLLKIKLKVKFLVGPAGKAVLSYRGEGPRADD